MDDALSEFVADVVLVLPGATGDTLLLAAEPALPYFNWDDMTEDGSPLDGLRDAVESSDEASQALACLQDS